MQLRLRPDLRALPRKLLVGGTWLLALALTAWIVATWYWHLSGTSVQSARPSPVSDPAAAAQDIASRQLFGTPAVAAASNTPPLPNFTVVGLSTRWGKLPGYAVIRNGASAANPFIEGEEITPGIKLVRVLADAIEIDRNGVREEIKLSTAPRQGGDVSQNRMNQPAGGSAPAADN